MSTLRDRVADHVGFLGAKSGGAERLAPRIAAASDAQLRAARKAKTVESAKAALTEETA